MPKVKKVRYKTDLFFNLYDILNGLCQFKIHFRIFHLGSKDLVHHDDFIKEIVTSLGDFKPLYKRVYTTNEDRYLAVLPKINPLPKHLQLYSQEILSDLEL